jgi:hypothetical protein
MWKDPVRATVVAMMQHRNEFYHDM